MKNKIAALRKEYSLRTLTRESVDDSPINEFEKWFEEAINAEVNEPAAMTLATAGVDGQPSARVVLLKDISGNGLTFYTNYESKKGRQLMANPKAALAFFWPELERQVRFEGLIAKVAESESDEYFSTRPGGSQAGARASRQSSIIKSREILEAEVSRIISQYKNKIIPRPDYWGGYRLTPFLAEFWQGRPDRLNDRIQYIKKEDKWEIVRLSP